jgi:hypothetical protein
MKIGSKVTVYGCRAMVPDEQTGTVTHITPTGRISVLLASGEILKFDADGFQLGREHPDYAINTHGKDEEN